MHAFVQFAFLGLGAGAAYAIVGQGLVLTFQGSGIVNFAQAAVGMVAAFQYQWFTSHGWSPAMASAATLPMAAVAGAALYLAIVRPLRSAPVLARLVATLGILLGLYGAVGLIYGTQQKDAVRVLPGGPMTLWGATFGRDRLLLGLIAVAAGTVLWAVSRKTKLGWLLRGAADSEEAAVVLGYSPTTLGTITWVASAVLASVAGILLAPITSVDATNLSFLVIPALAAALLAGFSSFPVVTATGLVLGVIQSEVPRYWKLTGAKEALPFIVIIAAMVVRGRLIPDRSTLREGRPPMATPARLRPLALAALAAVAIGTLQFADGVYQSALITTMVAAIVGLSVVVVTGYVGQISLAQMALAGLGAMLTSKLSVGIGLPTIVAIPAAAVLAVPLGVVIGLPALRVRGVNLAIVTLGAAVAVDSMVFNNYDLSGGFGGLKVPPMSIAGWSADAIGHPFRFGLVCLTVLLLALTGVATVRRSPVGLRMLAVRDNERAAAAEGVSLARTKLTAFAISSFLAAIAGGLYGAQLGQVSFSRFPPLASVEIVALVYIAGIGSVSGALLAGVIGSGGLVVTFFSGVKSIDHYQSLLAAAGLILTAVLHPDGLVPLWSQQARVLARQVRRRVGPTGRPEEPAAEPKEARSAPLRILAGASGSEDILLSVHNLVVQYGGVRALDAHHLDIARNTFVGLIGPNGAGKTTLVDAVCGFVAARGDIRFDGRAIGTLPAHQRARLGIRRTFQAVELFEDLTVEQNLLVAQRQSDAGPPKQRVGQALEAVGLAAGRNRMPGQLSNGERKLLGVARALIGDPKLLLLDEPAAGLDTSESEELGARLRQLLDMDVTVLLIDHDLELVMNVSDVVHVLDQGRLIASGTPAMMREDTRVRSAYIGDVPVDVGPVGAGQGIG